MSEDYSFEEFTSCVEDLINSPIVLSMNEYTQHSDVSCLEHCIFVSYISYVLCKKFGLDYRTAARGALLHDLFLYDWHTTKPEGGLHGFTHPLTALKNANKHFNLNDKEQDIIKKHMWPLVLSLPVYKESFMVCFADKYCAVAEIFKFYQKTEIKKFASIYKEIQSKLAF